jgi:hypothetical protein
MKTFSALLASLLFCAAGACAAQRNVPKDLSGVRGFDYTPANAAARPMHHVDQWLHYDAATTAHDLDLAQRLNLNQVRVFLAYQAWEQDKETFHRNLLAFMRACHERGIGVMPVVTYPWKMYTDKSSWPQAREWAADLVQTLGREPGLLAWDVQNEPDWPPKPESRVELRFEFARYMADVFHQLDARTPVTIGTAFEPSMEKLADSVDILQFHDYSPTREKIRTTIEHAQQFAAKVGKPVVNGEIGCVARANPYDVTLEEHMKAHMGWYIWELMIVRTGWGPVQGVFYADGSVRDPSIPAAILGFFRNRGPDILPSVPDREGHVTEVVENSRKWLAEPNPSWSDGLDLAETAANLMEAAQLVPMRLPPTRTVGLMRAGQPDLPALRELLKKYIAILEPYEIKKK